MRSLIRRLLTSRWTYIILALVVAAFLVWFAITRFIIQANYACDWTGFGACDPAIGDPRPEKTLWDWLDLLIVPAVLAIVGLIFTRQERANERDIAKQRTEEERTIAERRFQDETLRTYLDQMTELLLNKGLRTSEPGTEVRDVARVRTLIALRRLDQERRGIVMQFLRDSKLVGLKDEEKIVNFDAADLSKADLTGIDLSYISLFGINLAGAKLVTATFEESILMGADLQSANLQRANLEQADLSYAILTGANLQSATLEGANLKEADLHKAKLDGINLGRATLDGANLQGANLEGACLVRASLDGAKLDGAGLEAADLEAADLSRADLGNAKLEHALLKEAKLDEAWLLSTRVSDEQLAEAASLKGATLPNGQSYQPPAHRTPRQKS